jgi:hypothetical protein
MLLWKVNIVASNRLPNILQNLSLSAYDAMSPIQLEWYLLSGRIHVKAYSKASIDTFSRPV